MLRSQFMLKTFKPSQIRQTMFATRLMSSASNDLPYVTDKADLKPSTLPNVPKQGSYKIEMEQGKTYYWCTCGNSQS